MTIDDLAERLGVGYGQAAKVMASKGFPSMRIGRRLVVDKEFYENWYAAHEGCTIEINPEKSPQPVQRSRGYMMPDKIVSYAEAIRLAKKAKTR